ncbi:hypothetical protein NBRC110019_32030 [Neptunitalea chrysea]|uniref:HTH luxR-type domain-containing protein n=1 Tax=Neptunitalea chrysea TaxID=1647581 RepID=A0A9W6B963_9FLAO|nr:triple tyrosine motif-containing protein [Neptunitalea chrysea]GLB54162.1 hypothetical protein NBRC110019_32030 [Neptunitalea chrysea]
MKLIILNIRFFLFLLLFGSYINCGAQENLIDRLLKQPNVKHFSRKDFNSDAQFWSATEDDFGNIYFGNNDGILIYDGTRWNRVNLPNYSSVRSLVKSIDGKIYAGGYNELGIVETDAYGKYSFLSLKDSLKIEDFNFENVWQSNAIGEYLIFRTFKKLFVLHKNKLTQIPASNIFLKGFVTNNTYYVLDSNEGIFELNLTTGNLIKHLDTTQYNNTSIINIRKPKNSNVLELITENGTLITYNLSTKSTINTTLLFDKPVSKIISYTQLNDKNYLLGTLRDGAFKVSFSKTTTSLTPIYNIQDKTVLNFYKTSDNNVWVLLDNGLDLIDYNNPRTLLCDEGSVYDLLQKDDYFYIATNQGIYYAHIASGNTITPESFKLINGLEGQAWSLQTFENTVLAGHDKGLFKITNETAEEIGNLNSFWKVIPIKEKQHTYIACNYSGLYLLEYKNEKWTFGDKIKGFDESTRDILEADNPYTFWICHGYMGVYRVTLNESLDRAIAIEHFTDQNGFKSPFNINVYRWQKEIVFTTNNGIFSYNRPTNTFKPFDKLNNIVDTTLNTRKILEQGNKTWIVQDDELGYFYTNNDNRTIHKDIFLETKGTFNRGMECILPINENYILTGTHTGLYLYEVKKNASLDIPIKITSIAYATKNETANLPLVNDSIVELPNNTSSIHFKFSSPKMPNGTPNFYSYRLKNRDDLWSGWQSMPFKEYSLLPPGAYTFMVKARNTLGIETQPSTYTFYVLPKWYQTKLAMFLYVMLSLLLIYVTIKLVERKIKRENQKTRDQEQKTNKLLQLELKQLKLEKEQRQIQEDKEHLEQDVIKKSKELANYTMLLVNKKNFFTELQTELKELRSYLKTKTSNNKLTEIFHKLHQHRIDEEYLKVFEDNFETIHKDFFKNLKDASPDLSTRETRLAAFIKMGLTNKEIAPLLNISIRGVETARYRLRKKLDLTTEDRLSIFLESLSPTDL